MNLLCVIPYSYPRDFRSPSVRDHAPTNGTTLMTVFTVATSAQILSRSVLRSPTSSEKLYAFLANGCRLQSSSEMIRTKALSLPGGISRCILGAGSPIF